MTRSKLAKECGVNIESLRYYEKRRLIDPPKRSEVGYRLYSKEDAARIRFIQNAKKLGFTLNEILELLKLRVKKMALRVIVWVNFEHFRSLPACR